MAAQLSSGYLNGRISIESKGTSVSNLLFCAQDLQMSTKGSLEPCVPNIGGLPICRSDRRSNEVVLIE